MGYYTCCYRSAFVGDASFSYDGKPHSPDIVMSDKDRAFVKINGAEEAVDAGNYRIVFVPKDPNSVFWSDGVEGERSYDWEIMKARLPKPTIAHTEYVYNGGERSPLLLGVDESIMRTGGTTFAVDAGEYSLVVSLKDPKNYEWEDGVSDDITFSWEIKRRSVDRPSLDPSIFVFDNKPHRPNMLGFRSIAMNREQYDYQTAIGEYTITVMPNQNYEWSDGTMTPFDLLWVITDKITKIPIVTDLEFEYDGQKHSPKISNYDSGEISVLGVPSAVDAGSYELILRLNIRSDGTATDIVVPWVIHKAVLSLDVANTEFVYNGGVQRPTISGFDPTKMQYGRYSVIEETDAGTYKFSVIIADKKNYSWNDETTADRSYIWVIERKPVDMPYLSPESFVYDGDVHSPEVRGFNPDIMYYPKVYVNGHETRGGVRSAVNAGTYTIVVALGVYISSKAGYVNKNYKWRDDSIGRKSRIWKITSKRLKYPTLKKDEYEYNGEMQTPETNGFDGRYMKAVGDVSKKYRGNYDIGFILTDTKNYFWEEGVVDGGYIPWKITRKTLVKRECTPIQNPALVYNGGVQTPTWDNYNPAMLDCGGITFATDAGIYTAKFSPNDSCVWDDGTTDELDVDWAINKLALSVPKQYAALYYNGKEQEPVWLVMSRS